MLTFFVAFLIAVAVASILTPLVTRLAHRFQLFDVPDNVRKVHIRAIPRLGGIAVVTAVLTPIAALSLHENQIADALFKDVSMVWAFALGAVGIVALGLYDDLRGADAKLKFAVQFVVAVGLWFAGFRVDAIGGSVGFALDIGLLSLPITVLWIVGVVNAVNLIDGLDGLASGIALIAATALLGVALMDGQILLALLMASVAGALVGFLFFNFNPARIFLGDSGSLFLGYVLAVASLWTHHKAATATVVTALPLFVMAVPLLDTTLCIIRRVSRGQSPFSPDREHLHHRLMALGLTHKGSVLTLYAVAAIFALAGLALAANTGDGFDVVRAVVAVSAALVAGGVLIARVGLFGDNPPHAAAMVTTAKKAARQVRHAPSLDAAWRQVEDTLPALGCEEARLVLHARPDDAAEATVLVWRRPGPGAEDSDELKLTVTRGTGRIGEMTALWNARQDPPVRAAQRQALLSLHRALREVSARHGESLDNVAQLQRPLAPRQRLDAAE